MFERFTDRARRVVVLAQEEARLLNHDYIGTEHLLLGLLQEGEGVAAQSLNAIGVQLEQARLEVESRLGAGRTPPQGHMPFSPRAKKVLELALRQALRLEVDYIGTEHILLGLLTEGEGVAAQILLATVDGGLERVEEQVMSKLVEFGAISRGQEFQARQRTRMGHAAVRAVVEGDEVVKRLEAIEARLSAIERLLREQREETDAS
jgi:ATP-dependent Clp protease ATP-binding subunit ClpC